MLFLMQTGIFPVPTGAFAALRRERRPVRTWQRGKMNGGDMPSRIDSRIME